MICMLSTTTRFEERLVCKFCGKEVCLSCLWEGDLELIPEEEYLLRDERFESSKRVAAEAVGEKANHLPS